MFNSNNNTSTPKTINVAKSELKIPKLETGSGTLVVESAKQIYYNTPNDENDINQNMQFSRFTNRDNTILTIQFNNRYKRLFKSTTYFKSEHSKYSFVY